MRKSNRGFTLLEVLLVLVILAGAGFTLLVKLPVQTQSRNLAISATQLLEDLRDARQAALAENNWYEVRFYYYDRYYRILRQGVKVKDVYLQNGISFYNNPSNIIFNASGVPSVGATIALTDGKVQRKIVVAPVIGRIREQ